MGIALATGREEELVRTAIAFANLDQLEVRQVEREFRAAVEPKFTGSRTKWQRDYRFDDLYAFQRDVRMFLGLAAAYSSLPTKSRRNMETVIGTRLARVRLESRIDFGEDALRADVVAYPKDIRQACWLAIGLCLDPAWGFYDRLWLCEGEDCDKVILRTGKQGSPHRFCDSCKAKKAAKRMREWRKDKRMPAA